MIGYHLLFPCTTAYVSAVQARLGCRPCMIARPAVMLVIINLRPGALAAGPAGGHYQVIT